MRLYQRSGGKVDGGPMKKHKFQFTVCYAPMELMESKQRRMIMTTQKHHDFLAANKCALNFAMQNSGPTERIVSLTVQYFVR